MKPIPQYSLLVLVFEFMKFCIISKDKCWQWKVFAKVKCVQNQRSLWLFSHVVKYIKHGRLLYIRCLFLVIYVMLFWIGNIGMHHTCVINMRNKLNTDKCYVQNPSHNEKCISNVEIFASTCIVKAHCNPALQSTAFTQLGNWFLKACELGEDELLPGTGRENWYIVHATQMMWILSSFTFLLLSWYSIHEFKREKL